MSAWPYIIVFNDKLGTRDEVTDFLNTIPEVTYWYACLPSAVFCTATVSAGYLSDQIKGHFGAEKGQRFFVSEVPEDRQGWLPKNVWHMLKNPGNPRLAK